MIQKIIAKCTLPQVPILSMTSQLSKLIVLTLVYEACDRMRTLPHTPKTSETWYITQILHC